MIAYYLGILLVFCGALDGKPLVLLGGGLLLVCAMIIQRSPELKKYFDD